MTRAAPVRWFLGAFAAGALLAASLVTCSRCCRADVDPLAAFARESVAALAWRNAR